MTTTETVSPFLRPSEVARLLRCSRGSIYRRISNGTVPAVRLDEHGPLLVPRRELENRLFGRENP
jgi:excisionase family DNA binding protein